MSVGDLRGDIKWGFAIKYKCVGYEKKKIKFDVNRNTLHVINPKTNKNT